MMLKTLRRYFSTEKRGQLSHGSYGSRGTDGPQSFHGHNETSSEEMIASIVSGC